MGKRKAPVPHRRVGVHFVDVPVKRPSLSSTDSARMRAALNEKRQPSAVPATSLPAEDGDSRPRDTAQKTKMHVQHPPHAVASHLQHGKSIITTVPLRTTASPSLPAETPPQSASSEADTVTMTVAELNAWKQRTVFEIEDHFTNEQLKRIAEFGRVHANLLNEAKEYVFGIETQLKEQFEKERESLRSQAEAYVAQFQEENERLRAHVEELEAELRHSRGGSDDTQVAENDSERVAHASSGSREEEPVQTHGEDSTPSPRLDDVTETMNRAMGLRTPTPALKPTAPRVAASLDLP